jgi:glycosyltransferase involved in cell wall biosynthesis
MNQRLKQYIKSVWYYLSCKNYRIVKNSRLFDSEYYWDRVPGLQNTGKNPLIHYIDFGSKEGKSPSPFFDPVFYERTYGISAVRDSFVHYLTTGIFANHRPCKWFDPNFYQQQYLKQESNTTFPLLHYQMSGQQQGLYPNADIYELAQKPLLSIIVPVYNVSSLHLNNCIRSVLYQSYPHWELCLVDDCSTDSNVRHLLEKWAAKDARIKIDYMRENSGISAATNKAVTLASGDYLGFLDNDDELAVDCLFTLVQKINTEPADLYYTDEDLIGEDGTQFSVFYKPDFNSQLLLSHNYITHFVLVRKSLFDQVGGFSSDKDGAQDFDLLLKLSEQAKGIIHIPEVLYHWRASESSTSINHEQKSYADEAGRASVVDAMQRRDIQGRVDTTDWKFFYSVRRKIEVFPVVSVVIVHRQDIDFRSWLLQLVQSSSYPSVEFIVITDSVLTDEKTDKYDLDCVHSHQLSTEQSMAARYNETVKQCTGEYVVFLDAAIEIQSSNWIEGLLEQCIANDVGMVGGMLTPMGAEHSVSTLPDLNNNSGIYYSRFVQDCSRYMNGLHCSQNVWSLSWDFMMTNRTRFLELDGFDENLFSNLFADIDLCFRMREAGYTLVYSRLSTGKWKVVEERSVSSSEETTTQAKQQFQKKWRHLLVAGDPFYNLGVVKQAGIDLSAFKKWYAGEC